MEGKDRGGDGCSVNASSGRLRARTAEKSVGQSHSIQKLEAVAWSVTEGWSKGEGAVIRNGGAHAEILEDVSLYLAMR